jgi:hypothetical protein
MDKLSGGVMYARNNSCSCTDNVDIVTPVVTLVLCKAAGEADKTLEHPGRITLKGGK